MEETKSINGRINLFIYRSCIIFFLAICVSACTHVEYTRGKIENTVPESERSYLVGKYTVHCDLYANSKGCRQVFDSISLYYKNSAKKPFVDRFDSTNGSMFHADTTYDEINYNQHEKSFYFCRILRPGNYSIFNLTYFDLTHGGGGYVLSDEARFDIPFKLEAGKISVIDHLKITEINFKNISGPPKGFPGGLEISHLTDEELSLAIQKCPANARTSEIVYQNLWQRKYSSPAVKTKN